MEIAIFLTFLGKFPKTSQNSPSYRPVDTFFNLKFLKTEGGPGMSSTEQTKTILK